MNTQSKEYVEWMSNVWRLNDERNKRIEAEKQASQQSIT